MTNQNAEGFPASFARNKYKTEVGAFTLVSENAYYYALDVMQGRFKAGESTIAQSAEFSYRYARDVLGSRFELGEDAIAQSTEYAYLYAAEVLKGRFEAGEKAIAQSAEFSYRYARDVLGHCFELGEPAITQSAYYAYLYALHYVRGRFKAGEAAIAQSTEYAYLYARDIIKGRFEAGEPVIAQSGEYACLYAGHVLKGSFELGEKAIAQSAEYAYRYALDVVNGRFELGEDAIAQSDEYAYLYARHILKGPFPAGEEAISHTSYHSYFYAADILKGRFELGEPAIAQSAMCSLRYAKEILKGRFKAGENSFIGDLGLFDSYLDNIIGTMDENELGDFMFQLPPDCFRRLIMKTKKRCAKFEELFFDYVTNLVHNIIFYAGSITEEYRLKINKDIHDKFSFYINGLSVRLHEHEDLFLENEINSDLLHQMSTTYAERLNCRLMFFEKERHQMMVEQKSHLSVKSTYIECSPVYLMLPADVMRLQLNLHIWNRPQRFPHIERIIEKTFVDSFEDSLPIWCKYAAILQIPMPQIFSKISFLKELRNKKPNVPYPQGKHYNTINTENCYPTTSSNLIYFE